MTHCLKTLPEIFIVMKNGYKSFDIRRNDRNIKIGDRVIFQEYDSESKTYTGEEIDRKVIYMLQGEFGLPEDICVMQLCEI